VEQHLYLFIPIAATTSLFAKPVQYKFLQVYSYKDSQLLEKHLDPHHRGQLAARHGLGQSQQRRLRRLLGHVYNDADIRTEEGRGEKQRVRDVLSRRRRGRRHSRDDDARRRSLHGHHVERAE